MNQLDVPRTLSLALATSTKGATEVRQGSLRQATTGSASALSLPLWHQIDVNKELGAFAFLRLHLLISDVCR
jgi:hypothetical protein